MWVIEIFPGPSFFTQTKFCKKSEGENSRKQGAGLFFSLSRGVQLFARVNKYLHMFV